MIKSARISKPLYCWYWYSSLPKSGYLVVQPISKSSKQGKTFKLVGHIIFYVNLQINLKTTSHYRARDHSPHR